MFKKILVPLDGSALAEQAITPALAIARKFRSKVLLLRILVPEEVFVTAPVMAPQTYAWRNADDFQHEENEAESYLDGIRLAHLNSGVVMQTMTLHGAPPALIVAATCEQAIDLIVMSTHGRTGLSRLVYGSVAEAVMRGVHVPVMLVPNHFEH